ncbi:MULTISPECIES: 3-phosphoshikimate 1-carboxyvinyltransferase [unclassified Flavobacterium]|uniref:3-phosphoshikimate 1-carboxyvinyltransferase n=1 Tax=unclassified Flavobacterium TaxID=196869 RepID=UPI001290E5EB|nr:MULTISPECIES: 3-phosphoshikimate 1-carboxyvinyltransferase [unclassified Flavobacterium]MQP53314.1 3-phosphoshikimate 1-carboxyvinyltransferase [Flavobacterium sp. LMO9]MQP62250.1 3-phosphoshikimate 1-carboxyvinyltransferase [Flavobacterium sp. LMO6]
MNLLLQSSSIQHPASIKITGSKSETNRLLLLQALYPNLVLENTSNSDDSEVMQKALTNTHYPSPITKTIDVHHAGTAMRFLTAFFAIQDEKEVVLTGSTRMKERPIKILVDALNQLGAEISYEENEGFPPLRIKGKKLTESKVSLPANVSSQYISALLLIAPKLENGLELTLEGEITSIPYIKMTLALLNEIGVETSFENNLITVKSSEVKINSKLITVESDWSSASYWFSIVALSEIGTQISLSSYKQNSLQGDSALIEIYKDFGVETVFNSDNSITISKERIHNSQLATCNSQLNNCPDIAQTIVVTCFGLGIGCDLFGLHTLKIKETDRLEALKVELIKLGADVMVTNESLHLKASNLINKDIVIKTYQDHRMAMAFAPLALKVPIIIEDAEVVSKSYPTFWEDLKLVGFKMD